ncbi:MAG TPA: CYTH domain-containing protein [Patescibacteria group bacterium]|nr:CYTH domain-containing protein [Patescibacteria group bacterium]
MNTEFEAKFYPVDKEEYRKKLEAEGAKLTIPERLMRRVIADRRANPGLNCDYIRVRDEGNIIRLSAKIHADAEGKVGDQKEDDVVVSDFITTVRIFEDAGLKFNRMQETKREEWELDGATITIDTWPGLEPFTEIETVSSQKVKAIAEKLGFRWEEKILTAAAEIFCKVYGLTIDEVLEKISEITFENNPFSDMEKTWP